MAHHHHIPRYKIIKTDLGYLKENNLDFEIAENIKIIWGYWTPDDPKSLLEREHYEIETIEKINPRLIFLGDNENERQNKFKKLIKSITDEDISTTPEFKTIIEYLKYLLPFYDIHEKQQKITMEEVINMINTIKQEIEDEKNPKPKVKTL